MQQAIIRNTAAFLLVSHGNGLAYELREHDGENRRLLMQGDAAAQFRDDYAAWEAQNPTTEADVFFYETMLNFWSA